MIKQLKPFMNKPQLYAPGTNQFWNDEHISEFLLDAHLNPDTDRASRKLKFIEESVAWIASIAPPSQYSQLLDLGCGPGLYTERFKKAGYFVTGIDFSKRSIAYAKEQTIINNSEIKYIYQNYLTIDYIECYDAVALIYCDFGVLSTSARATLLDKVYRALKPGGKLILDVFTPIYHQYSQESSDWSYLANGGFWDKQPHICLNSFYRYDEDNTVLNQTIVINDSYVECYNIWEHCFTKEPLLDEAHVAGFNQYELYNDVTGKAFDEHGITICAVFTK